MNRPAPVEYRRNVAHPFRVQQALPQRASDYAEDFQRIMLGGWQQRFRDTLSYQAIRRKVDPSDRMFVADQAERIARSGEGVLYLAARSLDHPVGTVGFCRVEEYSPRNPLKRNYPNVTDLEVHEPSLFGKGQLSEPGMALLYGALGQFHQRAQVSLYSEEPNEAFNDELQRLGFREATLPRRGEIQEQLGDETLQYVHFVAESVAVVRNRLADRHPFLLYGE